LSISGKLKAPSILITGSTADDEIHLNLAGVTLTNPAGTVTIQAVHGVDSVERKAMVRDGWDSANTKRPYFLPLSSSVTVGDQLYLDDTGLNTTDTAVVQYKINGSDVVRSVLNGSVALSVNYSDVNQLNLTGAKNHNDFQITDATLPHVLQLDGGATNNGVHGDNRVMITGTGTVGQNISVGNMQPLMVGAQPWRSNFELNNISRIWVVGSSGPDVIDNISRVPALIDGGLGNDVINNIVTDSNSKFLLNSKKIAQSIPTDVSLVLGNVGSDKLFTGSGADDLPASNQVAAALKSIVDTGITFLIGDYKITGTTNNYSFTPVTLAVDTYNSSSVSLRDGLISKGADGAMQGIFAYGAGDTIKFTNTISWLKAQIFVKAAVTDLLKALAGEIGFFEDPVKTGLPEAPPEEPDTSSGLPVFSAATDVDRDGQITPLDALLVINDINARGAHVAPPLLADSADDNSAADSLNFDIDQDGEVAPLDSLLVINALNLLSESGSDVSTDVAADVAAATSGASSVTSQIGSSATATQAAYDSHDIVMLLLSSNSQPRRTI
ncbi:MAG TPA: dockerin type I domain-containing protein, partial [Pirellulales bacterium]